VRRRGRLAASLAEEAYGVPESTGLCRGLSRGSVTHLAARRLSTVGIVIVLAGIPTRVVAEGPLESFFPLVARRPVIEHELEMRTVHRTRRNGGETVTSLAVEGPILPRWGVSLSIPLAFNEPRDGAVVAGAGDFELESKAILSASPDGRLLMTAGLALTLPTGSARRGLGGQTALEPFAAVGLIADRLLIVSDIGYIMTVGGPDRDERRIHATLAVARPIGRRFIPLLALTAASTLEAGNASRRGGVEVYVTPGINVRLPRATLGLGVQLPVAGTRTLDHTVVLSVDWDL